VNSAISISTIGVGIGTDTPTCLLDVVRYTTGSVNNNYQFRILNSADGLYPYSVLLLEHNNRTGVGNAGGATILIKDGFANVDRAGIGFDYFNSGSYSANGGTLRLSNAGQGNLILATGGVDAVRVFKDQGVQIGGISTNLSSTARLLVKGSSTTSATIALLVQNSAGTEALKVRDDGSTILYGLGINTFTSVGSVNMNLSAGCIISTPITFQVKSGITDTAVFFVNGNNATPFSYFTGNTAIGSTTDLNARLGIKGSGSTSATTSLLVQNSAGNQLLKITDDGGYSLGINSIPQEFNLYGWNVVSLKINDSANGRTLSIYKNAGSNYLIDSNSDTRLSYGWGGNYFWKLNGQTKSMAMSSTVSDPNADTSAIVDFQSTTKGFLPPRMTTAQRLAIASPAASLIVFDTDVQNLCYRRDGVWVQATFATV
jgi:hypothetical protein